MKNEKLDWVAKYGVVLSLKLGKLFFHLHHRPDQSKFQKKFQNGILVLFTCSRNSPCLESQTTMNAHRFVLVTLLQTQWQLSVSQHTQFGQQELSVKYNSQSLRTAGDITRYMTQSREQIRLHIHIHPAALYSSMCSHTVCRTIWLYLQREVIYLYHYVISDSTEGYTSWAAIADCCLQLTWPPICIMSTMKNMAFNYTQIKLFALTGNNKQYPPPLTPS